jgi:putative oxidoreductase
MYMKKLIHHSTRFLYNPSFGLLMMRLVTGFIFLTHGWMKVQTMPQFIQFFALFGLPVWVAYGIAWLEVIGGLGLILGVAARIFGILFGIEMLVAAFLVGMPHGGFSGMEYQLLLAAVSFGFALMGSGMYSIFRMQCERCGSMICSKSSGTCYGTATVTEVVE